MSLPDSPWAHVPCDNTAFVFLTPNANTDSAAALVEKVFSNHKLTVVREGELACEDIAEEDMLDAYYSAWSRFDKKPANKSRHFADVMERFLKALGGVSFTEAAKKGQLYNPTEACTELKLTPSELYAAWKTNPNPEVKVTSGIVMKRFAEFNNKWIINGFFPQLKASLTQKSKYVRWWVVQWPEKDLKWADFRERVIGNKEPTKTKNESIRAILKREWHSLGLQQEPDLLENGVHGSGGPLEGLTERVAFTRTPFDEDELGRVIRNRYAEFGVELANQWALNNRISLNDEPFRPAYDVCENFQTSDFLDTIEQNILNDEAYMRFREQQAKAPWAEYPFLDMEPQPGVSLEVVWPYLVEDAIFRREDFERNQLKKMQRPDKKAIKECELKMNERNHAIAKAIKLWPFLDQVVEGLSLATVIVYLVEDPEFKILDAKRIAAMRDAKKGKPDGTASEALKVLEEKMNVRNHVVAKSLKAWPFLHPMPEGIPLNVVLTHLVDKDVEFMDLDAERLKLLETPETNEALVKEVEVKMDRRSHVVAGCLRDGWPFLDPFPENIPLPSVIPHLKTDPEFLRLHRERLELIDADFFGNSSKIKAAEEAMNERSHILARIIKEYPFLDTAPEGLAIDFVLPFLKKDVPFMKNDNDRIGLHNEVSGSGESDEALKKKTEAPIREKEMAMNDRNHELAKALKAYPYLTPLPEGLVLAHVLTYLKQDPLFLSYESERAQATTAAHPSAATTRTANSSRTREELEKLMDERNILVARSLKDWPFLSPVPEGILLADVLSFLIEDEFFAELNKQRLEFVAREDSSTSADISAEIEALHKKMDARSHEIAKAMKEYAFLSQMPEGLSLATVLPHLKKSDPEFLSLDVQRKALGKQLDATPEGPEGNGKRQSEDGGAGKGDAKRRESETETTKEKIAAKIKHYEEQMNVRNHTMAIILKDYPFLEKLPQGSSPLATIFPYLREDLKFKDFDKERRWLMGMASKKDETEAIEQRIRELENLMNERSRIVSAAMRSWPFLEPLAGGLPLAAVVPAVLDRKDPNFFAIMNKRRILLKDPLSNAALIKATEKEMDQYLHKIGLVIREYPFLDPFPEGIPIANSIDEVKSREAFGALEYERDQLMGAAFADPNEWRGFSEATFSKIEEVEGKMNAISVNVAYDRYAFLTQDPESLPLISGGVLATLKLDYLFRKYERKRKYFRAQLDKGRLEKTSSSIHGQENSTGLKDDRSNRTQRSHHLTRLERQEALYFSTLAPSSASFGGNAEEIKQYQEILSLEAAMDERNHAVARAIKYYPFLEKEPEGIAIASVLAGLLSGDPSFSRAESDAKKIVGSDRYESATKPTLHDEQKRLAEAARMQKRIVNVTKKHGGLLSDNDEEGENEEEDDSGTKNAKEVPLPTRTSSLSTTDPHVPLKKSEIECNPKLKQAVDQMNLRCVGLASALREYPFLDPVPIRDEYGDGLPLDIVIDEVKKDPEFSQLEETRKKLLFPSSHRNSSISAFAAILSSSVRENDTNEKSRNRYSTVLSRRGGDDSDSTNEYAAVKNEVEIAGVESKMNERCRALSRVIFERTKLLRPDDEYPFLDILPQGIPLRRVLPSLKKDTEFQLIDNERLKLVADNANNNGKYDAAIKECEKAMDARNHEVAAALKHWAFLDQFPEDIALSYVIPYLKQDLDFATLNEKRLVLLKEADTATVRRSISGDAVSPTLVANEAIMKNIERRMNDRSLSIAKAMKGYPFLDPIPEGIPLDAVFTVLLKDEAFLAADAERLKLWSALPLEDLQRGAISTDAFGRPKKIVNARVKALEEIMNERSHAIASAMKLWPFLDQLPEGLPLATVLPCLTLDEDFARLDKDRMSLLKNPQKHAVVIQKVEEKMNERNLAVARAMKAYPFLDPMPEGIPVSAVIPYLEADEKVFVPLSVKRLRSLAASKTSSNILADVKKWEVQMNARSHEYARSMKDYPFLDPMPHGIALCAVLPLLKKDEEFVALQQERAHLISTDPIKYAAKICDLEAKMNERNLSLALLLKDYPFLDPFPRGLALGSVLPVLKKDETFCTLDSERRKLLANSEEGTENGKSKKISEIEFQMNARCLEIADEMQTYPFLDPLPHGVVLSHIVLPILKKDDVFLKLDGVRIEAIAELKRATDELSRKEKRETEWADTATDELSVKIENAQKTVKEHEKSMNNRSYEVATIIKSYPFLHKQPHGVALSRVFPTLKSDPQFAAFDKERINLLGRSERGDGSKTKERWKQLELEMDERNFAVALLMKEYPFLHPMPEGVPISVVLPLLQNHDEPFSELDRERLDLMMTSTDRGIDYDEAENTGAQDDKNNDDANAGEIHAIELKMDERSHELARTMKSMMEDYSFLSQMPEGISLPCVVWERLSVDPEFTDLANQRKLLLKESSAVARADHNPNNNNNNIMQHQLSSSTVFNHNYHTNSPPHPSAAPRNSLSFISHGGGGGLGLSPLPPAFTQQQRQSLKYTADSSASLPSLHIMKRDKISLLQSLMDERNYAVARIIKAETERRRRRTTVGGNDEDWLDLPPGLLEAMMHQPWKRKPFPQITYESAPDDLAARWVDVDFNKRNTEISGWCKIRDLYEGPVTGDDLLPSTLSTHHFEHGITPECTFMVAVATILQQNPEAIRKLFVSKKVRNDGRYAFQFFRWDRWVRVEIDETIPMVREEPLFTRSPTCHWWPLLLEKAYAKLYGSYQNILNGSIVEALNDLTGMPVVNNALTTDLQTSYKFNFHKLKSWKKISAALGMRTGNYAMALVAKSKAEEEKPNASEKGAEAGVSTAERYGLKPEGVYGVRNVFILSPSASTRGTSPEVASTGIRDRCDVSTEQKSCSTASTSTAAATGLLDVSAAGFTSPSTFELAMRRAEPFMADGGTRLFGSGPTLPPTLSPIIGVAENFRGGKKQSLSGGESLSKNQEVDASLHLMSQEGPNAFSRRSPMSQASPSSGERSSQSFAAAFSGPHGDAPSPACDYMHMRHDAEVGESKEDDDDDDEEHEEDNTFSSEKEEDLSRVILELNAPYRKGPSYMGPYSRSSTVVGAADGRCWTSAVSEEIREQQLKWRRHKAVTRQKGSGRAAQSPSSDTHVLDAANDTPPLPCSDDGVANNTNTSIFVPLDVVLRCFSTLPICYLGAVKPEPFTFVEAWSHKSAGGAPSNLSWRTNPIFPIRNTTDKPITIIAQIKQPDQRERQDILSLVREGKPNPLNDGHPDAPSFYLSPSRRQAKDNNKGKHASSEERSGVSAGVGEDQADQKRDVKGDEEREGTTETSAKGGKKDTSLVVSEGLIHYKPVGITLVEQQPPPQAMTTAATGVMTQLGGKAPEVNKKGDDEEEAQKQQKAKRRSSVAYQPPAPFDYATNNVATHLLVPNVCRFLHKGVYLTQRDVANEIVLPPKSQCYIVPSCPSPGLIGSFSLSVFVPRGLRDKGGELDPFSPRGKGKGPAEGEDDVADSIVMKPLDVMIASAAQTAHRCTSSSFSSSQSGDVSSISTRGSFLPTSLQIKTHFGVEGGDGASTADPFTNSTLASSSGDERKTILVEINVRGVPRIEECYSDSERARALNTDVESGLPCEDIHILLQQGGQKNKKTEKKKEKDSQKSSIDAVDDHNEDTEDEEGVLSDEFFAIIVQGPLVTNTSSASASNNNAALRSPMMTKRNTMLSVSSSVVGTAGGSPTTAAHPPHPPHHTTTSYLSPRKLHHLPVNSSSSGTNISSSSHFYCSSSAAPITEEAISAAPRLEGSMLKAVNYREVAALFKATQSGTYAITIVRASGGGETGEKRKQPLHSRATKEDEEITDQQQKKNEDGEQKAGIRGVTLTVFALPAIVHGLREHSSASLTTVTALKSTTTAHEPYIAAVIRRRGDELKTMAKNAQRLMDEFMNPTTATPRKTEKERSSGGDEKKQAKEEQQAQPRAANTPPRALPPVGVNFAKKIAHPPPGTLVKKFILPMQKRDVGGVAAGSIGSPNEKFALPSPPASVKPLSQSPSVLRK